MKNTKRLIIALSFLSSLSHAFVTEKVPVGCGYTDFVYQNIPLWTQEKAELNLAYTGKQGETGRRLIMYSDKSWILTFEFFSKGDLAYDLSCVVMRGVSEEAYEALSVRLKKLPEGRLGPGLRPEDEDRLMITEE